MNSESDKLKRNIKLVFGLNAGFMFMVLLPVMVPFFRSKGLSMEDVFQLQAIFAFFVLILELPSGYVSDLLGRRKTLIVAGFLNGLGNLFFPLADSFSDLVVAEILLAFAVSLLSGTDVSLLYDSVDALEAKEEVGLSHKQVLGKNMLFQQSSEALAGLIGGWLVYISLNTPAVVEAVLSWIPLVIAFFIYEPKRTLMDKKKHKENFSYICRSLFKHSKLLNYIILIGIFYGLATLLVVWAFQKYWEDLGIPITSFGYLWASTNILVAITAHYAHRLEQKIGSTIMILIMATTPVIGYIGMGFAGVIGLGVWSIVFGFLFQISRGINSVVMKDALNRRVTGDMRATANSILSLGVRGLFVIFGPLLGYLIDQYGNQIAFSSFGYFYVVIFFLLVIPFLRLRKEFV